MINPVAMDVIHNNITKANSLYVGTFCLDRLYNQVGEFSSDVSFGRFSTARMLHVNNKPESLVYKKIMRKEPFVDSILANIDDYKTFFVYAFKDFPDKVFDFMNRDLFFEYGHILEVYFIQAVQTKLALFIRPHGTSAC